MNELYMSCLHLAKQTAPFETVLGDSQANDQSLIGQM